MRIQWDNKVISSFLLWLDNKIMTKGEAFTNYSSLFYRVPDKYSNFSTFGLPFTQIAADASINNCNIMSGIYLNGNFVTTGMSGVTGINYEKGHVYFSTPPPASTIISGNYAVKDFNVYLTNEADEKILFESKHYIRPKIAKEVTGLANNIETLPAIFIKTNGTENKPFAFGGTDETSLYLRAIILSDNQFHLDAVCGILRDTNNTNFAVFEPSQTPFNPMGGYRSGIYHYVNDTQGKRRVFINKVEVSRYNSRSVVLSEVADMNPGIFPAIVDFYICDYRDPRN